MIGNPKTVCFAVLLALALGVTACSSDNPATQLSVSTTTKDRSGTSTPLVTGGSITLSAAQVTLSNVKLAVAGTPCASETEDGDDLRMSAHDMGNDSTHHDGDEDDDEGEHDGDHDQGCQPVRTGPLTINLPLDATTSLVLDALVPPGTYSGVRAKLESAQVSGTFTDTAGAAHPFTFTANTRAELDVRLATPVTVGPTTSNVTVMVDVASWFKTDSGAVLDPTNAGNTRAITRNILRSFRAFSDRDHDGQDDDHDEHDGDDHHEHKDSTGSSPV